MKIAICGSTRFMTAFGDWDVILTKAGHIVYTICRSANNKKVPTEEEKRRFDLVHQEKIDSSDAILVLNVDGYIGETTRREIEWARMKRKDVYWLNNNLPGIGILGVSVWSLSNLFEDKPINSILESKAYDL